MKKCLIVIVLLISCSGGSDADDTPPVQENTAPTIPVQVYPPNNLLCADNPLELSWNSSVDNENDSITYEVQVSTNETFTSNLQTNYLSQTNSTFLLESGVAYYWRVRAEDSEGEISNYSPVRKFYTEGEGISNYLPFAPTLIAPPLNSHVEESSTTLEWDAVDVDNDPLVFDLYFGSNNPPSLIASEIDTNFYTVNVNSGTTYYWKIVVKDNNGGQAIGQVWNFHTN